MHRLALAYFLLVSSVFLPAVPAQQDQDKDDFDAAAALHRLRLIGLGDYIMKKSGQPPICHADVDLCLRAIQDESPELVAAACRGFDRLSSRKFFAQVEAARRKKIVDLVIDRLQNDEGKVASAAASVLSRFDSVFNYPQLRFSKNAADRAKKEPPLIQPPQLRLIVTKCLAMALLPDPDVQFRAGKLLRAFADNVKKQMHSEIARTLLVAIRKHRAVEGEGKREQDRLDRGIDGLKSALAAVPAPDAEIAKEQASLFLADSKRLGANHWSVYSKANSLHGLAGCVPALRGDERKEVVDYLVAAAEDRSLTFMITSGIRSPFFHHGIQAAGATVPHLTSSELERVAAAVKELKTFVVAAVEKRTGGGMAFQAKDLPSMFGDVEKSIAARRRELQKEP